MAISLNYFELCIKYSIVQRCRNLTHTAANTVDYLVAYINMRHIVAIILCNRGYMVCNRKNVSRKNYITITQICCSFHICHTTGRTVIIRGKCTEKILYLSNLCLSFFILSADNDLCRYSAASPVVIQYLSDSIGRCLGISVNISTN